MYFRLRLQTHTLPDLPVSAHLSLPSIHDLCVVMTHDPSSFTVIASPLLLHRRFGYFGYFGRFGHFPSGSMYSPTFPDQQA
jgi:hypothetical protein